MPTYNIYDTKTKKTTSLFISIAEMETLVRDNPTKRVLPASPAIHSGRGMKKPDQGFRDILRTIKKNNRGSTINTFD